MSLYTISVTGQLPSTPAPAALRMARCEDVELLSLMGCISEDEVKRRFSDGHIAFVAFIKVKAAAFGWMATKKAMIGELHHELDLPRGNRYLWNFRTLEAFRGLGIYPALLQYILRYEKRNADRFWIIHAPENHSSLKGIRKAGFQYVGKLYSQQNLTLIDASHSSDRYRELLSQMDIHISENEPASCWNCSSPHLKKRKPECCCEASDTECAGNRFVQMAY